MVLLLFIVSGWEGSWVFEHAFRKTLGSISEIVEYRKFILGRGIGYGAQVCNAMV